MRAWVAAVAGLVLAATSGQASAQGFFDFLLGGAAPAVQAPDSSGAITVHRRAAARPARKRHVDRAELRPPANVAIDPVKVADWYLKDPTLRRGDIIVLKSGVLVFTGRHGEAHAANFARLRDARGIPAKTRDFLAKATAANAYAAEIAAPPKPRVGGPT